MNDEKDKKIKINRRGFIQSSLAAFVGLSVAEKEKPFGGYSGNLTFESQVERLRIKEYRTLGRTGFKASDIGFGAGNLTDPVILEAALDMGINYIDTGEHYTRGNSERIIGKAIKFVHSHPYVHSACLTIDTFEELELFAALSGKRLEPVEKDWRD